MNVRAVQAASMHLGVLCLVDGKVVVNDDDTYRKSLSEYCRTIVEQMAQTVVDEIVLYNQPFTKWFPACNSNILDRTNCRN